MAATYTSTSNSTTFIWKTDSRAGEIPAHVYYGPKDDISHPIAIYYHIGGFVLGSTNTIPKNQVDYLVSKGFIVVLPEYRLAPQVDIANGPVQDAKDSYLWTQEALPALLRGATGIEVDNKRIVSIGASAGGLLALSTGTLPNPPVAIVDFYGTVYLDDDSYKKPLTTFSQIPTLPEDFINKIYDGPVPFTSKPMFVDGKPVLDSPRAAWFLTQLKNGTSVTACVPDGDYSFDVSKQFNSKFPPTFFLHGKIDIFVSYELSVRAHEELKKAGNESELLLGEDIPHVFDLQLDTQDPKFTKYVRPALDFAVNHV